MIGCVFACVYHVISHIQGSDQSEFVSCHDRNRMVKWLCLLNHDLHYRLEVFFRATNLLDQFLSVMRVGCCMRERERKRALPANLLGGIWLIATDIYDDSISQLTATCVTQQLA